MILSELINSLDDWFVYNVDLDNPKLPMYKELSFLFEAIHSHNKNNICYSVHKDWREKTEKTLEPFLLKEVK